MSSSAVKCEILNQTNKLPGTIYSTTESSALGYSTQI